MIQQHHHQSLVTCLKKQLTIIPAYYSDVNVYLHILQLKRADVGTISPYLGHVVWHVKCPIPKMDFPLITVYFQLLSELYSKKSIKRDLDVKNKNNATKRYDIKFCERSCKTTGFIWTRLPCPQTLSAKYVVHVDILIRSVPSLTLIRIHLIYLVATFALSKQGT